MVDGVVAPLAAVSLYQLTFIVFGSHSACKLVGPVYVFNVPVLHDALFASDDISTVANDGVTRIGNTKRLSNALLVCVCVCVCVCRVPRVSAC